jgi:hypothetical protein
LSKRSLFNLSASLCLLALLLVPYTISGCTVSETSSVSQEETVDVPNEAAQPKVDTTQLLADLGTLSDDSFEGRKTGTVGNQRAREYIVQAFEKHGLQPFDSSFIQPFSFFSKEDNKEHRGANVVGYIEGASNPERYIVITAHYDHLGVINGQIYNGADDNASGTAALFAVADYFSKHRPDNSVILVATDGEELGEEGSKAFVARPPVGRHAIVVNVNLDMIAHDDQNKLYVAGTYQYPFLKPYVEEASKDGRVELVFGLDRPYPRERLDVPVRQRLVPRGQHPVSLLPRGRAQGLPQANRRFRNHRPEFLRWRGRGSRRRRSRARPESSHDRRPAARARFHAAIMSGAASSGRSVCLRRASAPW